MVHQQANSKPSRKPANRWPLRIIRLMPRLRQRLPSHVWHDSRADSDFSVFQFCSATDGIGRNIELPATSNSGSRGVWLNTSQQRSASPILTETVQSSGGNLPPVSSCIQPPENFLQCNRSSDFPAFFRFYGCGSRGQWTCLRSHSTTHGISF